MFSVHNKGISKNINLNKMFVRLFRYLSELSMWFVRLSLSKPGYVAVFISMTIFFSSCRKVIDVDIKNVAKKFVVEAVITDQQDSSKVLLSTTKNVSENNDFPGISGAAVTVTDNTGIVTTFTEDSAGYYYAHSFKGVIGKTYTLQVIINGETFTAVSAMPPMVNMDTLYISDEVLFGESRKLSNTTYQDPPGKGNCYRYVQYINGKKENTIFTNNDDYTDGKYVEAKLWYLADDDDEDQKIKSGDTVRLDLFCIDPAVYKYWFSLNQSATGNSQSASPANAVTNITGGALGYFSAHTVQSKTVVAP
jgi:hypothetical protein